MNKIIERYKKIRKRGLIEKKYNGKYAFVGIGNHSINNLYPVLNYLNVDIKYIVVKSKETQELVHRNFPNITVTTNLEEVLADQTIKGVFVSTNPSAHFGIVKQILEANKNVFVEKPPCSSLTELEELIVIEEASEGEVLTGFQRRYSPVYTVLKKQVKKANYYTIKYKNGGYPEGDELLDLFIHPLDIIFFLFGNGTIDNIKTIKRKGTIIYLAQVEHNNGVFGSIEFSTDHSWVDAIDVITINTPKGEYSTKNTSKLTLKSKPKVIFNIPLEKVKSFNPDRLTLYQQNSFLPVREHNQLYSGGYYNEIETFLKICEKSSKENNSPLNSLRSTFNAIEKLSFSKNTDC